MSNTKQLSNNEKTEKWLELNNLYFSAANLITQIATIENIKLEEAGNLVTTLAEMKQTIINKKNQTT